MENQWFNTVKTEFVYSNHWKREWTNYFQKNHQNENTEFVVQIFDYTK